MRTFKTCLMATVAVAAVGVAETANAQTFIYGGGATFPSKVYRQLFDCLWFPVDGNAPPVVPGGPGVNDPGQPDDLRKIPQLAISTACPSPTGNISGQTVQFLYSPVGSGGGKRAFRNHNGTNSGTNGLGVPAAANTIPYVSQFNANYGYPSMHFAGSDDVVLPSDIAAYTGNANNPNHPQFGYWIQLPALAGGVAVAHNQNDGNGNPLNLSGGTLKLSRQALCGIVSGHITKWNNPILTALNGGTAPGTGQITFVHRSDGSGTSFLFSNALVAQCAGVFGPNNEGDATLALYNFPWTDKTLPATQCPAIPVQGSNQHNYPDAGNTQCGAAVSTPAGSAFANGSGNAGVVAQVHAINGAIGYSTPDFVDPVVAIGTNAADGLPVAGVQNQFDIDNFTGQFQKPTFDKAAIAMRSAIPQLDDNSRPNPLNWSRQMIVPNPTLPNAYPITGFTMLNVYQCYADSAVYTAMLSYLSFHYQNSITNDILHTQQFTEVPGPWFDEVVRVLTPGNPVTGFNQAGNGPCAGKSGA